MISPQLILPIHKAINVDLFAGGGGASLGSEMALGRHVDIAVNHNPVALSIHKVNHPQTTHYISDVFEVDPKTAAKGMPVGFVWASPDCRHFSVAKGGVPVSEAVRGLAWVVRDWARDVRPQVIAGENVPEMLSWGPLDENGFPEKDHQGETFDEWVSELQELGYEFEYRILVASDYGAPTTRKRLYFIARCDGQPIVWPKPTHAKPNSNGKVPKGMLPWNTAATIVDFSIEAPSIFGRKKPLVPATCRRIVKGIQRYVLSPEQRFIVPADRLQPARRDTNARQNAAVKCAKFITNTLKDTCQDSPDVLVMSNLIHLGHGEGKCGKKRFSHGIRSLEMPLNTVTASGAPAALIMSYLVKLRGTNVGSSMHEPLHTISAQGTHHAEVRLFMQKWAEGYTAESTGTPDSSGPQGFVVDVDGELYMLVDIGFRMLTVRELYRAQSFPDSYVIDRDENGTPITKTNQIKMVGNSVCPVMAKAIIQSNHPELNGSPQTFTTERLAA